jgi:hypothetical protein
MEFLKPIQNTVLAAFLFSGAAASAVDMNFRFSPDLIVGLPNFELNFETGPNWSFGPLVRGIYFRFDDRRIGESEIGLRGDYYFNGTFKDGWFLSPQLTVGSAKITDKSEVYGDLEGKGKTLNTSFFGGYGWYWTSFNMDVAGGLTHYSMGEVDLKDSRGTTQTTEDLFNGVRAYIEFNVGWVF